MQALQPLLRASGWPWVSQDHSLQMEGADRARPPPYPSPSPSPSPSPARDSNDEEEEEGERTGTGTGAYCVQLLLAYSEIKQLQVRCGAVLHT